jgi:predicted permease
VKVERRIRGLERKDDENEMRLQLLLIRLVGVFMKITLSFGVEIESNGMTWLGMLGLN